MVEKSAVLNGQLETVWGLVALQLEPVAALATLRLVLEDPEPLDVGVFLVANAADHSVGVHGVDNVGILFGALSSLASLQEKGILKKIEQKITTPSSSMRTLTLLGFEATYKQLNIRICQNLRENLSLKGDKADIFQVQHR